MSKNLSLLKSFPQIGPAIPASGKQVGDHVKMSIAQAIASGQAIRESLTAPEAIAEILQRTESSVTGFSDNVILGGVYIRLGAGRNPGSEACDWDTFVAVLMALAEARHVTLPENLGQFTRFQLLEQVLYAPFPALRVRREGENQSRAGKQMSKAMIDFRAKIREIQESKEIAKLQEIVSEKEGLVVEVAPDKEKPEAEKPIRGAEQMFKHMFAAQMGNVKTEQIIYDAFIKEFNGKRIIDAKKANKWLADVRAEQADAKKAAEAELEKQTTDTQSIA